MYWIKVKDKHLLQGGIKKLTYCADNIEDILSYILEQGMCPSVIIHDDEVEIGSATEYLQP
jgi:hypothetical protein